jgi:SAM-dependent methyltransferase
VTVIPFYGADDPDMFAVERRAMDRDGLVVAALDVALPSGLVLDVGAGDGFTADRLATGRTIVGLEPAAGMIRPRPGLRWIRGDAEHLPFADASFDAAYATWAYFFSRDWDPTPGIAELDRVVRRGGLLGVVENLGGDAFSALTDDDISADPAFWEMHGFRCEPIDTVFRFDDLEEGRSLLGFFFGDRGRERADLEIGFRVGLFTRPSHGVA